MIPKIIHYCWFGGKPLDKLGKKCLESWKKFFPDYEIKEWNESNFDVNSCRYVKEAYEAKKWAFVSDYARFKILYEYGGVYFDTDVEVIKPFDEILSKGNYMGCERKGTAAVHGSGMAVNPGLGMAVNPGLGIIKEIIEDYDESNFIKADGTYDLTTIVERTTKILKKHGLSDIDKIQTIEEINIYPTEYFCPKSYETGKIVLTENTVCIHHFSASWISKIDKKVKQKRNKYISKYGEEEGKKLFSKWYKRNILIIYIKKHGLIWTIKKIVKKLKGVK
jgi:hypothetical protein